MLPTLLHSAALVLLSLSLAKANYHIDDSNSTITYTGDWWVGINEGKTYNKTYHASQEDGPWAIDIPFTGSGITLYIVNTQGHNLTASIDGASPTKHTIPSPSGQRCPIPEFNGSCPTYGVAIYDIQGLYTDKPHTLHIVPDARTLYFDYAAVNDTVLLSPTSSAATKHSRSSKTIIGAVVGGAVGGITVIAVVIFMFLSLRRKKQARKAGEIEIDPDYKSTISDDGDPTPVAIIPTLSRSTVMPAGLSPPPTTNIDGNEPSHASRVPGDHLRS